MILDLCDHGDLQGQIRKWKIIRESEKSFLLSEEYIK